MNICSTQYSLLELAVKPSRWHTPCKLDINWSISQLILYYSVFRKWWSAFSSCLWRVVWEPQYTYWTSNPSLTFLLFLKTMWRGPRFESPRVLLSVFGNASLAGGWYGDSTCELSKNKKVGVIGFKSCLADLTYKRYSVWDNASKYWTKGKIMK